MASLLRQIVAGPRSRHAETGLDLCYVTDRIIATSGPSGTYPKRYYRNPLEELVKFLDAKHKDKWAIWEFRAEGTGYPDEEVYDRIWHFPWPDHHPPPFALIPRVVASMRNWLHEDEERVCVVHCKAGKGRSGTGTCAYLIAEEGWTRSDALQQFTARRMRPGFGAGVSIPSQLRYLTYVDRWKDHGKVYVERQIEIVEVHVWGLRDGVKAAIRGFVDEGKVIKTFHTFTTEEREIVAGELQKSSFADLAYELIGGNNKKNGKGSSKTTSPGSRTPTDTTSTSEASLPQVKSLDPSVREQPSKPSPTDGTRDGAAAIFRPSKPVILPTSDVNFAVTRHAASTGSLTLVTSVGHVWFNCFFEGNGPERRANMFSSPFSDAEKTLAQGDIPSRTDDKRDIAGPLNDGVFEIEWEAMDGIKGTSRKGSRALDRIAVVWRAVPFPGTVVTEPGTGERVLGSMAADWRGEGVVPEEPLDKLRDEGAAPTAGKETAAKKKGMTEEGAEETSENEQQDLGMETKGGMATGGATEVMKQTVNRVAEELKPKEEALDMDSDDEMKMVKARGPKGEDNVNVDSREASPGPSKTSEQKS